MDFNALQHKLFAMDPTDPAEDLAKLRAQAGGNAPAPAEKIDYITESASVPEGSLQMDRNYSVDDFAALAGVVVEKKQKPADQVRGSEPMPAAEPGRKKHPYQDRLVGEEEISELEVVPRGTATPTNINQTLTSIQRQLQALSQTIQQLQNSVQQMSQQPQQVRSPNPNRQTMSLNQMPSIDLNSKQNKKTPLESVDSIKEQLYARLNRLLEE